MAETVWITIVLTDLDDYLVAAQRSALSTAALRTGQADPFLEIMPDIILRIRAKIKSCPTNQVSSTVTTIPPELKWVACYLILEAMQVRLPSLALSEGQRAQIDRAVTLLDRIADCKDLVTAPGEALDPSDVQGPGAISVVTYRERKVTRETMEGL